MLASLDDMAKYLYINFSRGWGGLEMASANLFEWLLARGEDLYFFVYSDSPLHKRLLDAGLGERVVALKPRSRFGVFTVARIKRFIEEHQINLVQTFKSTDIFFAVQAVASFNGAVKLVHQLQMLPKHSRKGFLHKIFYKKLDMVIAISDAVKGRIERLWPINPAKIKTVYYGIDLEKYGNSTISKYEEREKLGLPKHKTVIGIVGQICPNKGQLLLLKAFNKLKRDYPDAVLAIVGAVPRGDEGYMQAVKRYIKKHNLEESVFLLGFSSNVQDVLTAFDVFVHASSIEAFGLVIIEAMIAGVPVVASATGGVPEIVSSGNNGFLFTPESEESLLEKLQCILALNDDERKVLSDAARKDVAERFNVERYTDDILSCYQELVCETAEACVG